MKEELKEELQIITNNQNFRRANNRMHVHVETGKGTKRPQPKFHEIIT